MRTISKTAEFYKTKPCVNSNNSNNNVIDLLEYRRSIEDIGALAKLPPDAQRAFWFRAMLRGRTPLEAYGKVPRLNSLGAAAHEAEQHEAASIYAAHAPSFIALGFSPIARFPDSWPKSWSDYCAKVAPEDIRAKWGKVPGAGLALACGYGGLIIIDVDDDTPKLKAAVLAALPHCRIGRFGSKGFALLCRHESGEPRRFKHIYSADLARKSPLVEIKGDGQNCMVPPSLHHKTGRPYFWFDPETGTEIDGQPSLSELPIIGDADIAQLYEAMKPWAKKPYEPKPKPRTGNNTFNGNAKRYESYGRSGLNRAAKELAEAREGRPTLLFKSVCGLAWTVHHGLIPEREFAGAFIDACGVNGLRQREGLRAIEATIDSALSRSAGDELPELEDRPKPRAATRQRRASEKTSNDHAADGPDGNGGGADAAQDEHAAEAAAGDPGYPPDNIGELADLAPELTTKGGKVKKSYVNTAICITKDLKIRGSHDVFANRRKIVFRGELVELDDPVCRAIQAAVAAKEGTDGGIGNVQAITQYLCELNAYHPVRQYLENLAWDKKPRMAQWLKLAFGCEQPDPYIEHIGTMFLISMVARIMQPGCQADYMLIIEGDQGKQKSSALRALVGNPEWFSDNLPDLGRNSDMVRISMHLQGKWLIEAPEMHATGNADNSLVKSFITRREERYVPKHGRMEVHQPRQCIFAGSTNKEAYFTDETGERRYWPIRAETIDLGWIGDNRDQLWAEAVHAYNTRVNWWPTAKFEMEHIRPQQRDRKVMRALTVPIRKYLDGKTGGWPIGEPGDFQFEIWKHLSENRYNPNSKSKTEADFTNAAQSEISKVLKDLGYTNAPRYVAGEKSTIRKWWPPSDKAAPTVLQLHTGKAAK